MPEYIEREALLKFIENGLNNPNKLKAFGHDAVEIMAEIQYMPTADVAPVVHGRWELIETGYGIKIYECSECKDDDYWKHHFAGGFEHYCPNCGARMDGE